MGCGTTIFGPGSQYIKINGGDFIAIQGSNVIDKLITKDLQIPFSQILKSNRRTTANTSLRSSNISETLRNSGPASSMTTTSGRCPTLLKCGTSALVIVHKNHAKVCVADKKNT